MFTSTLLVYNEFRCGKRFLATIFYFMNLLRLLTVILLFYSDLQRSNSNNIFNAIYLSLNSEFTKKMFPRD